MQLLKGHISPETAFLVDDYPYGYSLRCKIRYWLEYAPKRGFRFVSQTSNPKRGHVWNKPKASTYARFGAAMFLDDKGHVQWSGLTEYCDGAEAKAFSDTFRDGVPPEGVASMDRWVAAKVAYDAARAPQKADGNIPPLVVGLKEAREAYANTAIRVIRVYDHRPTHTGESLIATHRHVPRDWSRSDIMERFGIASHLDVFDGDENGMGAQIHAGDWRLG
jgi:hypothetical protein